MTEDAMVIIVRHGESQGNVDHKVHQNNHQWDVDLTEKGIEQIKRLAQKIKDRFKVPYVDNDFCFISSPYLRAQKTKNILKESIKEWSSVTEEKDDILLSEQCYGKAEGCESLLHYLDQNPKEKELYNKCGELYYKMPRGESLLDVHTRASLFWQKIIPRITCSNYNENYIICGHKVLSLMMHAYATGELPEKDKLLNKKFGLTWLNGEARVYEVSNSKIHFIQRILPD